MNVPDRAQLHQMLDDALDQGNDMVAEGIRTLLATAASRLGPDGVRSVGSLMRAIFDGARAADTQPPRVVDVRPVRRPAPGPHQPPHHPAG